MTQILIDAEVAYKKKENYLLKNYNIVGMKLTMSNNNYFKTS